MTTVTESIEPPTHLNPREADPKRWLALAVIAVAQLMVVLDASIVNIALPSAQQALHISTANRQWVITAYTLAFGGLLLLGGRIADYVGRKRMFIIGLLGFAAASALGGVAENAAMLFGARALQGAFAAMLAPAALSLITVTFTEVKERATAFGVYGAISGGGAAIGLIMGGVLTQYASWRWCLLVNVPIAIVTARRGGADRPGEQGPRQHQLRHPRGGHGHRPAWSPWSTASPRPPSSGWTADQHAGLSRRRRRCCWPPSWSSSCGPRTRCCRCGSSSTATAAARSSRSLMVGSGLMGMFLFLTYYFQGNLGYSRAQDRASPSCPSPAGIILAAGASSKLIPRTGPKPVMVVGFAAAALGLVWLTQIGAHTSFASHVLPAEILISLGMGWPSCR